MHKLIKKSSTIYNLPNTTYRKGFTIVELLVVIVVIGVLATITTISYSGIQSRAQIAKINTDIKLLSEAIQSARITSQKTLLQLSGSGWSAGGCYVKADGTDLATLSRADSCWVQYLSTLNLISTASDINVINITDPWGRPYSIDENEGEGGGCGQDSIGVYSMPFVTMTDYPGVAKAVPLSGLSGCAT